MKREDWLLLTVSAAGGTGLSPAQLQKCLFLLDTEIPGSFETGSRYFFSAYNYGPFSKQIYDDAEFLAASGLLRIDRAAGRNYAEYSVTPLGMDSASKLRTWANQRSLTYLETVVNWAKQRTFSELIRAIYNKYPAYRQNSVFQD
jgi:hypothetical protein